MSNRIVRGFGLQAKRRSVFTLLPTFGVGGIVLSEDADAKKRRNKNKNKNKNKKRRHEKRRNKKSKPVTRVDATCPGPTDGDWTFTIALPAQAFTALASRALVSAQVLIHKVESTFGAFRLRLTITDGPGVATHSELAATTIDALSVPNGYPTVSFTFANQASIVAGTRYALVPDNPQGNGLSQWMGHGGNSCHGESFLRDAGQIEALPEFDHIVTTFVRS